MANVAPVEEPKEKLIPKIDVVLEDVLKEPIWREASGIAEGIRFDSYDKNTISILDALPLELWEKVIVFLPTRLLLTMSKIPTIFVFCFRLWQKRRVGHNLREDYDYYQMQTYTESDVDNLIAPRGNKLTTFQSLKYSEEIDRPLTRIACWYLTEELTAEAISGGHAFKPRGWVAGFKEFLARVANLYARYAKCLWNPHAAYCTPNPNYDVFIHFHDTSKEKWISGHAWGHYADTTIVPYDGQVWLTMQCSDCGEIKPYWDLAIDHACPCNRPTESCHDGKGTTICEHYKFVCDGGCAHKCAFCGMKNFNPMGVGVFPTLAELARIPKDPSKQFAYRYQVKWWCTYCENKLTTSMQIIVPPSCESFLPDA